jgi:hypothetical protein
MSDTIERTVTEKITRPSRQWRNRFLPLANGHRYGTTELTYKNVPYDSHFVWPSKEVAEQKAFDEMARLVRLKVAGPVKYLGAFPVEGTP